MAPATCNGGATERKPHAHARYDKRQDLVPPNVMVRGNSRCKAGLKKVAWAKPASTGGRAMAPIGVGYSGSRSHLLIVWVSIVQPPRSPNAKASTSTPAEAPNECGQLLAATMQLGVVLAVIAAAPRRHRRIKIKCRQSRIPSSRNQAADARVSALLPRFAAACLVTSSCHLLRSC